MPEDRYSSALADVSKNEEFRIKNEEFCITNEEFVLKTRNVSLKMMNSADGRASRVRFFKLIFECFAAALWLIRGPTSRRIWAKFPHCLLKMGLIFGACFDVQDRPTNDT